MIELRALGPLDLCDQQGFPLEGVLAQPKRAALLVYLVLARPRGNHTRDTLLTTFWPEADDAHARSSLSQSLYYLRREIPAEVLISRGPNLKVDATKVHADVFAFEEAVGQGRWQNALDLYKGELLSGFHVAAAPDFEHWIHIERDRLRELAAKAAWARAKEWIAVGKPLEAERTAQRALLLAPTDETPVREFIEALAAAGERAAALSFYDRFRRILARMLEVDPSPDTAAVGMAVRNGTTPMAAGDELPPSPRQPQRQPDSAGASKDAGSELPSSPRPESGRSPPLTFRLDARWPRRNRLALAITAVLILAATVSILIARTPGTGTPRVMVLPFENQTGDASLEPLGRMVSDWISNSLIQVPEIRIVPRELLSEALAGARQPREAWQSSELGRMAGFTGATVALTGVFYRRGNNLEFHTQLLDLSSNQPMAIIEPVQAPVTDPLQAIDSLRIQVLGALATRLSPMTSWELPRMAQPPTYDAYLAFLQGSQSWLVGEYAAGAHWFEEAFAQDTTYLRALMWAWAAHMNAGNQGRVDSLQAILRARRDHLSRYDQYWLDVYSARTNGNYGAWVTAARGAVELNPLGPLRLSLVLALLASNRPGEAREELEDWMAELPLSIRRYYGLSIHHANVLHTVGDYREELMMARRRRDEIPAGELALAEAEGRALAALGDLDSFRLLVAEVEVLDSEELLRGQALASLAMELRAHGHRNASLDLVERTLRWHARLPAELRSGRQGRQLLASLLYMGERWSEAADLWGVLERGALGVDLIRAVGRQGTAAARLGDPARAEAATQRLTSLETSTPTSLGQATLYRARIAAVLGKSERAVPLMRQAFSQGQAFGLWLHRDMDLESLRGYGPYEQLVAPEG